MKHRAFERRDGSATVEFALLLPLLAFLLVIGVDFARVFYYSQIVENAARNGAIWASDPQAPGYSVYPDAYHAALAEAGDLSPAPTVSLPLATGKTYTGTDAAGNPYVQVTVSWTFNSITGYAGVPKTVTLPRTGPDRASPSSEHREVFRCVDAPGIAEEVGSSNSRSLPPRSSCCCWALSSGPLAFFSTSRSPNWPGRDRAMHRCVAPTTRRRGTRPHKQPPTLTPRPSPLMRRASTPEPA